MTPSDYRRQIDRVALAAEREIDDCEKRLSRVRKLIRKLAAREGYYRRLAESDEVKPYKRDRARDRAAVYESVVKAIEGAMRCQNSQTN